MQTGNQFDLYDQLFERKTDEELGFRRDLAWAEVSRRFRPSSQDPVLDRKLASEFFRSEAGEALAALCVLREQEGSDLHPQSIGEPNAIQQAWGQAARDYENLMYACFGACSEGYEVSAYSEIVGRKWKLEERALQERGQLFDLGSLEEQWRQFDVNWQQEGPVNFRSIVQDVNGRIVEYLAQPLRTKAFDAALLRWGLAAEYFGFREEQKFKRENLFRKEKPPALPPAWVYALFSSLASMLALFAFWLDAELGFNGVAAIPVIVFVAAFTIFGLANNFIAQWRTLARPTRLIMAMEDLRIFAGFSSENPQRISVMLREAQAAGVLVSGTVWALIDGIEKREITLF